MPITSALKRNFVTGLILVTPLIITLYILRVLSEWALQFINPIVAGTRLTQYTANVEAIAQLSAAILIVLLITIIGYIAEKSVGRRMFGNIGRIMNVIPLVNTIYGSVRQVANSLVERNTSYEGVVLVEYPREDLYSIGLVTGKSPESVEGLIGQDAYNVFLPNSPNPTAGRLVLLPENQVHEIDMSVRRGIRLIVTTGMESESEAAQFTTLDEVTD